MKNLLLNIILIMIINIGSSWSSDVCPTEQPYNKTEATRFWNCSRVSYCPIQNIQNYNCGEVCEILNLTDIMAYYEDKKDLQFFVGYSAQDNSLYLTFRGTDFYSLKSWLQDADFIQIDYPYCDDCKIHQGFYNDYYNYLHTEVLAYLEKLKQNHGTNKVKIMGHSMGGAFTVISSLELIMSKEFNVTSITTFGCPRVGNKHFAAFFDETVKNTWHYRIVHYQGFLQLLNNQQDLVPHIPPDFLGYKHTDEEVWYYPEDSTQVKMCKCSIEDPTCSNSLNIFEVNDHVTYMNLTDHACADSQDQQFRFNLL